MKTITHIIRRWRDILTKADTEPIGLFLSTVNLLYGVALLQPGNTFANPAYALIAAVAPEHVWGLYLLTAGILGYLAIGLPSTPLRLALSLTTAITWAYFAVQIAVASNFTAAGPYHFSLFALTSFINHLRILSSIRKAPQ